MGHLEMRAQLRVRPGQLDGFKMQAAELMRLSRELDTKTLRYDWYLSEDGTQCEVHEAYEDERGLFEHNEHVLDARTTLLREYADDHRMTAYGDVSQQLMALTARHAGGLIQFEFLRGLQQEPMV
jgi:quinol monooxygenase YgiN